VSEGHLSRPLHERLDNPLRGDDTTQGHVARGDALGEEQQIGPQPVAVRAEPFTQPPKGADDLVEDEDYPRPPTDVLDTGEVAVRRSEHPAGTDRGLAVERCDSVGTDCVDDPLQCTDVVPRDFDGLGVDHVGTVGRDAGERRSAEVHAVVGVGPRDEDTTPRLAQQVPVGPHHLDGRVDCVRATAGKEDGAAWHRRLRHEPLCEGAHWRRREITDGGAGRQLVESALDRPPDLRASVTGVREPQPSRRIEVLTAVGIPDDRSAHAYEGELAVGAHGRHVREGVPQPAHVATVHSVNAPILLPPLTRACSSVEEGATPSASARASSTTHGSAAFSSARFPIWAPSPACPARRSGMTPSVTNVGTSSDVGFEVRCVLFARWRHRR